MLTKKNSILLLLALTLIGIIGITLLYFLSSRNSTSTTSYKSSKQFSTQPSKNNNFQKPIKNNLSSENNLPETSNIASSNIDNLSHSFGVHPSSANNYQYANDLGLNINREGFYFIWNWMDANKNNNLTFKNVTPPAPEDFKAEPLKINYDEEIVKLVSNENIKLIRNICPIMSTGKNTEEAFTSAIDRDAYQKYVWKVTERYDGDDNLGCVKQSPDCYADGDGEYPTDNTINVLRKNPIKYWQVCNLVTDLCASEECFLGKELYASKFAEAQKLTYLGVKKSCPECQVIIAGDSDKEMYPEVYKLLKGNYIDIIDIHLFGKKNIYTKIESTLKYLRDSLEDSNFNLKKLRFWITETGTYSGEPLDDEFKDLQTEAEQASGLVKIYASAFGEGVESVLWAWGIKEGFFHDCKMFDYTGLIYDGNKHPAECLKNDKYDKGDNVKKLSYYSYKLLLEKIKDFKRVEKIQNSHTYLYKFTNTNNKTVYIAWGNETGNVTLTNIKSDAVKITEAVPKSNSGADLNENDYPAFFTTKIQKVNNGNVTINLNTTPIFIEDGHTTAKESQSSKQVPTRQRPKEGVQKNILDNAVPPYPQNNNMPELKKCGDGICDKFEKSNPEICPQDCR